MRETSVPTGWSVKSLGDLGQVKVGLTYKPENVSEFGTLVLRSSNIQNDRLAFHDNVFVDIPVGEGATVHSGDLLICVRNGSRRLIGKTAMIDQNAHGMAFGAFMSAFRSDLNPYLIWLFQSQIIQEQIEENLGATINQITNATLKRFKIPLPDDPKEQEAIAEALSDADALIEGLERLIAKKRLIKQGAMQDLLTAKRRLPGFSGDWEVRRLGDIFEIGSSKRVFQSDWRSFGIPFYRAREIVLFAENSEIEKGLHISPELYESLKKMSGVPEIGDLLVTGVGTLGRVYLVSSDAPFYFKDGNIIWFKIRGSMSSEYLKQVFKTDEMMQQIYDSAGGSTVGTYTISNAKKTRINFPPVDEQAAIARVLTDMDAEVQALDTRLEKARQVKEGMMQNLLTGRIRLV